MALVWALVMAAAASAQVASPPYFVVVAPEKIRPYSDFVAAVTMLGTAQPVNVTLGLYGTEKDNNFIKTAALTIEPNSTKIARIPIKELKPDEYNFTIQGDDYFKFENSTNLRFVDKFQSIFIQTDKAMYKPGHKVQFRVLVLDAHLKPSNVNKIDVTLKDGQNNRVKEWKKVEVVKGVFSDEIQLSSYPVLGDWTISVKSGGKDTIKKFTVAEYVLPKFEVTVDVPQHATFSNSKVPVNVYAKYTYGAYVKGEATIKVKPQYTFYKENTKENVKVIQVDSVGQTVIDIVDVLGLTDTDFYERTIVFDVSFKEELTGKVLNGSGVTRLHHAKCKVDFHTVMDNLTPGEPYKTLLKISNWDDTPFVPTDKSIPVRIRYGKGWTERENASWKEYPYPAKGVLDVTIITDESTDVLNIEAEYQNITAFNTVSKKIVEEGKNSSHLDLTISNEKVKIGDTMNVEVSTKGETSFVSYQVVARGELLETKTQMLEDGQRNSNVKIPITQQMAPESHILLYYISARGELVAAEKEIRVDNLMSNYVKLSASPNETEPGKETVLQIESKPNSFVGLMGIDQSVILLKKGNDISKEDVENELRSYDTPWYGGRNWYKRRRSAFGWYPGYSVRDIFLRAGAVVMTNAYVPEEKFVVPTGGVALFASSGSIGEGRPIPSVASSAGAPGSAILNRVDLPEQPVIVRTKFPETWIWDVMDLGAQGKTTLRKVVPDTITSWVVTGFSISPEHGFGLSETPATVKVFRPFFISLNLPYSVTRGEAVVIPANVFNYMDKEVKAEVTLENPGWFSFVNSSSSEAKRKRRDSETARTKTLTIGPNSAATANFVVEPNSLGYLEVKVLAKSAVAGDGVSRKLLVKPEGETQYRSKGVFVDLRNSKEFKTTVDLDIPDDIVPESELIEVSAVGDLLGSALQNLDQLIKQPYGCGEQNMLNFVPNIVILDYLKNSGQLTSAIEKKAIGFLEMGYQRELTYKHKDNAYSAFGETDKSGSTWLTAFVAKSFKQAQKFIDIDNAAVVEPLRWLASKQSRNGSFPEVGHVSHKSMQGGASQGLALTAYVLTAFVESMNLTDEFKDNIERGFRYLNEQIEKSGIDAYSLAVATYALTSAGHPAKEKAFQLLEKAAKSDGEIKWWEKEKEKEKEVEDNYWDKAIPNSINIEMTSYALLTYLHRNLPTEGLPILKWLLAQQNADGGFASTQDTVVALGAIARLAKKLGGKDKNIAITFQYSPGGPTTLNVDQENSLVLQKAELSSKKIRSVTVDAKGSGFAVVQVSYRYNVAKKGATPSFNLSPKVDETSTKDHLILNVCVNYKGNKGSNMAVMEVTLPSGFTIDDEGIKSLRLTERVKRVETKDEDTVVVLYFDKVTSENICPAVSAYRSFKVAKQRPVPVTVYDYYDNWEKINVSSEPAVLSQSSRFSCITAEPMKTSWGIR